MSKYSYEDPISAYDRARTSRLSRGTRIRAAVAEARKAQERAVVVFDAAEKNDVDPNTLVVRMRESLESIEAAWDNVRSEVERDSSVELPIQFDVPDYYMVAPGPLKLAIQNLISAGAPLPYSIEVERLAGEKFVAYVAAARDSNGICVAYKSGMSRQRALEELLLKLAG